ncbi:MAG TPA: hypothetical protein VFQ53_14610 [Kofleriaceae bacterium]|nr:hypothetical protein [Kofleriaceae bacterium]
MRETKRVAPLRPVEALDGVSDHLAQVLRRADELLVEWSRFGAEVRTQVDAEARQLANAVALAVDGAVSRATMSTVDRAIADQIGSKLAALAAELSKLETRAKAAGRAIADERRTDRRLLWAIAGGVLVANVLLALVLLRGPTVVTVPAPPEPSRVEVPATAPVDAGVAHTIETPDAAVVETGSAAAPAVESGSGSGSATPKAPIKPAKLGPPSGAGSTASPVRTRRK